MINVLKFGKPETTINKMHSLKDDFLKFQAKTNPYPLSLEIKKAKGSYIWDLDGNAYTDMSIMAVGACILGYADDDVDEAVITVPKSEFPKDMTYELNGFVQGQDNQGRPVQGQVVKIDEETIRLLELQKNSMLKFLMKIPKLYYTKSHFPLEISQRAFDHLWRVCESYEMWCKETDQENLIDLDLIE